MSELRWQGRERPGYGSIGKSGFAMTPSERERKRELRGEWKV